MMQSEKQTSPDFSTQQSKQNFGRQFDRLCQEHLQLCHRQANWNEIWRLFLNDDAFLRLCDAVALRTIRKFGLPADCLCDIKQEALLSFAKTVQRHPCLGFDADRGCFGSWLRMLLTRCCAKALRQFRDRSRQGASVDVRYLIDESYSPVEHRIDAEVVLKRLDDRVSRVMQLRIVGTSVTEIATKIGCGEHTVYRLFNRGLNQLQNNMKAS